MKRVMRGLLVLLVVGCVLIVLAWRLSLPPRPDAFLSSPLPIRSVPGQLLGSEPFARGLPAGARAMRMLYATTRDDGTPALSSAIVLIPLKDDGRPRHLVAWTHGTTGVATGCAPSLLDEPFANVPALAEAMAQGWVVVATDYTGLGTDGVHPYLIGGGEARSALDAIRAVRQLPALRLASDVVVWGHSQGGHAALWTGILAPTYAPDVRLAGVVAMAPASDLVELTRHAQFDPAGKIISSFIVHAYSAHYPELRARPLVRDGARWAARDMARRCMAGLHTLPSVAEAVLIRGSLFDADPGEGDFGAALRANSPEHLLAMPLLVAQGATDTLVLPDIQRAYVKRRCSAGQALTYRELAGRDHLSLVAADSPLVPELLAWTQDRFKQRPFVGGCTDFASVETGRW